MSPGRPGLDEDRKLLRARLGERPGIVVLDERRAPDFAAERGEAASAAVKPGRSAAENANDSSMPSPATIPHGVQSVSHDAVEEDEDDPIGPPAICSPPWLAFALAGPLAGQDAQHEKAMMEAWQKAATPGEGAQEARRARRHLRRQGPLERSIPVEPPEDSVGTSTTAGCSAAATSSRSSTGSSWASLTAASATRATTTSRRSSSRSGWTPPGTGMMFMTSLADKTGKVHLGQRAHLGPADRKAAPGRVQDDRHRQRPSQLRALGQGAQRQDDQADGHPVHAEEVTGALAHARHPEREARKIRI